jgi:hypothetical protein
LCFLFSIHFSVPRKSLGGSGSEGLQLHEPNTERLDGLRQPGWLPANTKIPKFSIGVFKWFWILLHDIQSG